MSATMSATKTLHLTNGSSFTVASNESTTQEQIPQIDISHMYSERFEDRQALAEEIRDAAHSIGFFCITNHVSTYFSLFFSLLC
jgi:hypothetical protein